MANTPISGFASGAPAQAGDEFVIARSGANFKLTNTNISSFVLGGPTTQLGAADVASGAVAQTLQVQSNTGAATTGPNFTIKGSSGTTAGGSIIFQTHNGTAYGNALTIASTKVATFSNDVILSNDPAHLYFGGTGNSNVLLRYTSGAAQSLLVRSGDNSVYGNIVVNNLQLGAASQTVLNSDAANTLALKNSTNPQIFRAYSTTTGPSYGYFASGVTDAGVATADTLFIGTGGAGAAMTKLALVVNGTSVLSFSGSNGTFSGNAFAGGNTTGCAQLMNNGLGLASRMLLANGGADGVVTISNSTATDFGRLQFGGTTSSFPALKRSTTTLQVRLADDTGDAAFQCGTATSGGTALDVSGTGAASIFNVVNTTTGTLLSVVNSSSSTIFSVNDAAATGVQVAGISFGLTGNISAAAWTTSGIRYRNVAATLTDTSSSGTVATAYTDVFGGNTIAASSSTTYTNYATFRLASPTAGTNVTFTNSWALSLGGSLVMDDATNIAVGTTTGTKIGTATSQKIGFWNAAPIVQPTTAVAAATVAATGTGDVVAASTTFDGYTIPQIVKAMRNAGLLA